MRSAPKALDKKELNALLRAVERYGSARDQAIIQVLRHSGFRVGEPNSAITRLPGRGPQGAP